MFKCKVTNGYIDGIYNIYKKELNGWWLNGGLDNYQQNCTFINGFWMQIAKMNTR